MPTNGAIETFWDFSVRTYRTESVPDACLSLQNDYGADVNMLLYCCWIGAHLGKFDADLFAQASNFSTQWAGNVVIPLRSARTWMKKTGCDGEIVATDDCMQLREEIKTVEFACEKMQQQVLESLLPAEQVRSDSSEQVLHDVIANLVHYAEYSGFDICEDVRRKFAIVIAAAFPDSGTQMIDRGLEL
jgi:uncharacterized protein (TIGR02444 family)